MPSRRANGEGSLYLRSDGLWTAQYTDGSGRRRYFYARSKGVAAEALQRHRSASRELTAGAWFERWLETYVRPSVRPRTYAAYYREVHSYIIPALGDRPLTLLDTDVLQNLLNDLLTARRDGQVGGYARSTVAHTRTRLISALEAAVECGLISKNPAHGLRLPPYEPQEKRVFTPSEQRCFEAALRATFDAHPTNVAIMLMLRTGLRAGEALGLRMSDLELNDRTLYVRRTVGRVSLPGTGCAPFSVGEPKTRRSRRAVPMDGDLVADLRHYIKRRAALIVSCEQTWRADPSFDPQWLEDDSLFITRFGGLVDAPNLRRMLASIEKKASLPPVGLHGLRHTFATRWVENGLDIKSLSELLGHSDAQLTLNIYTHSLPEQKRACVDKLAKLLR